MLMAILERFSLLVDPRDFLRHCQGQRTGLRDRDCAETMPSSGHRVTLRRKQVSSKTRVPINADGDGEVSTVRREGGGGRIPRGESLIANGLPIVSAKSRSSGPSASICSVGIRVSFSRRRLNPLCEASSSAICTANWSDRASKSR
jgi:hypothetical protein